MDHYSFSNLQCKSTEVPRGVSDLPGERQADLYSGHRQMSAGRRVAEAIGAGPRSNDTGVACQTKDLAANVKAELLPCLQICTSVLQMDKSVEVAGLVLLTFVPYHADE